MIPAANADPLRFTLPFHMVWLATNGCNARCSHCSSNSARPGPDELSTAEALRMVDQLAAAGVLDLAISGGEPLLRRDLREIAAYATGRGFAVGVGSNGGRLTARQAAALHAAGINRFQLSLDGFAASHEALRHWPGLFERVLRSIRLAADAGLRVHLCCTITRLNYRDLRAFAEFVATLPVARLNVSRYVPTGRQGDALDLDKAHWHAVMAECSQLRRELGGRLELTTHLAQEALLDPALADSRAFVGCQAGRGQGCINSRGDVYPCVLLPVSLGNIRERPFVDIWTDAAVNRQLRSRELLGGACGGCAVRERCGGCRAVAYATSGDWLAEDPRCWLVGSGNPAAPTLLSAEEARNEPGYCVRQA